MMYTYTNGYKKILHILLSLFYACTLLWIYEFEILKWWGYFGFEGNITFVTWILCVVGSAVLALILPVQFNTRALILTLIHYAYFLPSLIILITNNYPIEYPLNLCLLILIIHLLSRTNSRGLLLSIRPTQYLYLLVALVLFAILLQIAYGGLRYFNLNLEKVYQFRRSAAADLPSIFGYMYSNIANVLIPFCIVLSLMYKRFIILLFVILCSIILFGMTHQKSVFFTPFVVIIIYITFNYIKNPAVIGFIFIMIPILALLELLFINQILSMNIPGIFTSYSVRRVLLVPPFLDKVFVEYFNTHPMYFWSTSKFSFGLVDAPTDVAASMLVGRELFGDDDMSANIGALGSGYSHAGLIGVVIYAVIIGAFISILDAFGRRIGHAFVAAVSALLCITIFTSADLTTALLTHGMLMLVVALAFTSKRINQTGALIGDNS